MRFTATLLILTMFTMVFAPLVPAAAEVSGRETSVVIPQFGSAGADFTVIATSADDLNAPRDLEFHPSSAREWELWVANRATESFSIIHDAGQATQWSENKRDQYADHFMADLSAFAFGQVDSEFDYIFSTAQESRNGGNDFMGPALWPSSLDHFAEEHQNDGDLGSHLDMLHESPQGMGIAHDSGNSYWYFDGFHGNLVYYDFQADHDTGQEEHDDGIVRRYSEVELNRYANVPGHMELDKSSGMLYIADTGNNRILWVDTDAPVTLTPTTAGQMETLEEYSEASGASWGVLSYGITRPSGLVLGDDYIFVSEWSTGKIHAYEYDGTHAGELETGADEIMGLELDPDGNLWFVDKGDNRVYRVDPKMDMDLDGFDDDIDNCPSIENDQSDVDSDGDGDACDDDDDGDGLLDDDDGCPQGDTGWIASTQTDIDGDGCQDAGEDLDDDDDGVLDIYDNCQYIVNENQENYDLDANGDVCDDDDDNDGVLDVDDDCSRESGSSTEGGLRGCVDSDSDGWADTIDDLPNEATQWSDPDDDGYGDNPLGNMADDCPTSQGYSTVDRAGCIDSDDDGRSDPDATWGTEDGADAFRQIPNQWSDTDSDGFGDNWADAAMDSSRVPLGIGERVEDAFQPDYCPQQAGSSTIDSYGCPDRDGDGWSDVGDAFPDNVYQWADADGDGYGDNAAAEDADDCPSISGSSYWGAAGCPDSDGDEWADSYDDFPLDENQWKDSDMDGYGNNPGQVQSDACTSTAGTSTLDRFGCPDGDGDGYSDLNDALPDDEKEWMDDDMDGVGNNSDSCGGTTPGSEVDESGCTFSQSMMQTASKPMVFGPIIGLLIIMLAGLVLLTLNKGRGEKHDSDFASAPDFSMGLEVGLQPAPGIEMPAPIATQPAVIGPPDPARDYYNSLLAQGYQPQQAMEYTVVYYPQFQG